MMRKWIILIGFISLMLTGCWDSTELNDVSIVTGMAIDPGKEHNYLMSVAYINPRQLSTQSPEQGAPVTVMSLEGNSLPEIAARMNIGVSRHLVFSHTRVLYINEKVAEKGIGPFLDSLERSPQFRNDFNILVTKGQEAKKFIMINDPLEKVPSLKVQKQIEHLVQGWGGDARVRLTDFINAIVSKGRSPVASAVKIEGDPEKGKTFDSTMSTEPEANVILDGMGVFDRDRLIGYLTLEDTRNYLWTQKLENTTIVIPCDEEKNEHMKGRMLSLVVTNNKTKLETEYKGNTPQLKIRIYAEARVNSMECEFDLTKIDTFGKIEEMSEEYIDEIITGTIKKVQKDYGVDIFGFGDALKRQDYQKAKEIGNGWREEFKRAEVDVSVEMAIRRSGTRNKSFLNEIPEMN